METRGKFILAGTIMGILHGYDGYERFFMYIVHIIDIDTKISNPFDNFSFYCMAVSLFSLRRRMPMH